MGEWIATILLVRKHAPKQSNVMKPITSPHERAAAAETQKMLDKYGDAQSERYSNGGTLGKGTHLVNIDLQLQELDVQMKDLRSAVNRIEIRVDEDFEKRLEMNFNIRRWKYLALVLDRFFFTLYFLLIVISLSTLFPRASHK